MSKKLSLTEAYKGTIKEAPGREIPSELQEVKKELQTADRMFRGALRNAARLGLVDQAAAEQMLNNIEEMIGENLNAVLRSY